MWMLSARLSRLLWNQHNSTHEEQFRTKQNLRLLWIADFVFCINLNTPVKVRTYTTRTATLTKCEGFPGQMLCYAKRPDWVDFSHYIIGKAHQDKVQHWCVFPELCWPCCALVFDHTFIFISQKQWMLISFIRSLQVIRSVLTSVGEMWTLQYKENLYCFI